MPERQLKLPNMGGVDVLKLPPPPLLKPDDPLPAAMPLFDEYMRQKEFADNTQKSFRNDLKLLVEFLGPETTLRQCSTRRLDEFVAYLQHGRAVPCSGKSLDRRITTLKVFFRWLFESEVLPHDPAEPVIHRRAVSPLPQILTPAQVEAVLDVTRSMRDANQAPDARPHLLVTLILGSAIKKSECLRLKLEHIDLSDPQQPVVYIHYDKPRQRAKQRRLALPGEWTDTLEVYLRRYQPREYLFECTGRNLEYVLHTLSALAGLRLKLTFEMLRWTSAAGSLRAGMDPERLRQRLGLSEISWHETLPILQKLIEQPL